VLLVVAILVIGVVARVAGADGTDTTVVGVEGTAPAGFEGAFTELAATVDREVEVIEVDAGDTRRALDDGRVVHDGDVDTELQAILQQAWSGVEIRRALDDAGIDADQAAEILSPEPLAATTLDDSGEGDGDDEPDDVALLAGTMAAILLFFSLHTHPLERRPRPGPTPVHRLVGSRRRWAEMGSVEWLRRRAHRSPHRPTPTGRWSVELVTRPRSKPTPSRARSPAA
jgi:hypothetical protein